MADFAAVLRKAIEALKENTPEARGKIYQKARVTIEAKLAAVSTPPQVAERQRELLEEAIEKVEAQFAPPAPPHAADDDLESLFSELQFPDIRNGASVRSAEEPSRSQVSPPAPQVSAPHQEQLRTAGPAGSSVEEEHDPSAARPSTPPQVSAPYWEEPSARRAEPVFGEDEGEEETFKANGAHAPADFSDAGLAPYAEPQHAPVEDVDWSRTTQATVEGPEALPPYDDFDERLARNAASRSEPRQQRRGGIGKPILLLLLLLALGAAGYGGWLYRDEAAQLAGFANFDDFTASWQSPAEQAGGDGTEQVAAAPTQPAGTAQPAPENQPDQAPQKFTQRLMPDGREVDEGPAGDEPGLGEGTSVAQSTPGAGAPVQGSGQQGGSAPNASASGQEVAVGQKAIFYEERTSASEGYAESGSVVWSVIEESPGDNLPPEPAIQAEATIPEKGLQLRMTIRRNADQSLPASHIVELIFLTPENFPGGGINNVLRMNMKRSEQDTGSPLVGMPVKIADGFFLVALSDTQADQRTNSTLLRRQSWIDIPIIYTSGRRALITLEKGLPGERIFNETLDAWSRDSSG